MIQKKLWGPHRMRELVRDEDPRTHRKHQTRPFPTQNPALHPATYHRHLGINVVAFIKVVAGHPLPWLNCTCKTYHKSRFVRGILCILLCL